MYKVYYLSIRLLVCYSLFFSVTICNAQEQNPDKKVVIKIDSLLNNFEKHLYTNQSQATIMINTALELSKAVNYNVGLAWGTLGLARIQMSQGKFESALDNYNQSITLAKEIGEIKLLFLSYKHLGTLYRNSGLLESALENYLIALDIAEKENFPEITHIYNNVGLVYNDKGLYKKGKDHFKRALDFNPDVTAETAILNNLGISYNNLSQYDSALHCYKRKLKICKDTNNQPCIAITLGNIGDVFLVKNQYNEALQYLFQARELEKKIFSRPSIPVTSNIGMVYNHLGDYDKALKYFREGIELARATKSAALYKMHANMSLAYSNKEQFDLAWEHLSIHNDIKDSLINENSNKRIDRLLSRFEVDKKEREIELLNKEKELQAAVLANKQNEIERKNQIRNITLIGSFIILIPTLILLVVYQQKVKAKELLAIRNEEVNRQKTLKLIQDQEIKTIKAEIDGQEKERMRIAGELHDGLGGTLASIKLNLVKFQRDYSDKPLLAPIINNIDEACQEIRTISHHLTPSKILSASFIKMLDSYLSDIAKSKGFELSFNCHPENKLNSLPDNIKTEVYRILQELMSNIVKHAKADYVEVQLTQRSSSVNLIVEDSGIGFDATKDYHGIGLNNIKSRVSLLKGNLDIDSSEGRGTIVNIDIPLAKKAV